MLLTTYKNGHDRRYAHPFQPLLNAFIEPGNGGRATAAPFTLKIDLTETTDAYELVAAVPGLSQEEVTVEVNEGKLTISGERKIEKQENTNYLLLETSYGAFSRTFNLPEHVNQEEITANMQNGMLFINLPKDVQKTQKRRIEVQTSLPHDQQKASVARTTRKTGENNTNKS